MHKILVIRLYFLLDALRILDYISPSSGASFCKLYIAFGIGIYQMPCTAYKVAPDDRLIQSETCRASNGK